MQSYIFSFTWSVELFFVIYSFLFNHVELALSASQVSYMSLFFPTFYESINRKTYFKNTSIQSISR